MATYKAGKRQRAPTHPGTVVRSSLAALGTSEAKHAEAMGMTRAGLSKILLGKAGISPKAALLLSAYLGTGDAGAEHLLAMQADYDLWHARRALGPELDAVRPAKRN